MRLNLQKQLALSHAELTARLDYDPYSGAFTWRNGRRAGQRAGTINKYGYRTITLKNFTYYAGRLAWFYMRKKWPRFEADHINRKNHDDRWANLRQATRRQNVTNRQGAVLAKSGVRGVYFRYGKFIAYIGNKGKLRHLGCFETLEEASRVRQQAVETLHGEFAYAGA